MGDEGGVGGVGEGGGGGGGGEDATASLRCGNTHPGRGK